MSAALTVLRDAYGLSLVAVALSALPATRRAFTKSPRPKDFDYMLFFGLAVNRVFFLWWIVRGDPDSAPHQDALIAFCYVLGIAFELGVVKSLWWNRRHGT